MSRFEIGFHASFESNRSSGNIHVEELATFASQLDVAFFSFIEQNKIVSRVSFHNIFCKD